MNEAPSKGPVKVIEALVGEHHWITRGYEIEWYIPPAVLTALWDQAVSDHMTACTAADEPFYKRLAASDVRGTRSAGDNKVMWAERAITKDIDATTWFSGPMGEDLRANVQRVADFIRHANQMEAPATATCGECGQPAAPR